ncbi:hypothetical protein [Litoribacter populi]|uniref:hypothetical protein n=1 Tax=Litoribacter populi TaxID=2598460 RepID=UPI00117E186C|nr:hypothetical protein [Litoribacter populi]
MSRKTRLNILGVMSTFLIQFTVFAQSGTTTYSSLGIGHLNTSGFTQNQAMGGLGISYGNSLGVNHVNPALSVQNYAFNFQAAFNYNRLTATTGDRSAQLDGGGLGYAAMSLPVKPSKMSIGVGLNQISSVNYDLSQRSPVQNSDLYSFNVIEGNGGLSETYVNTGFKVAKNFHLGLQASYVFGSTVRTNILSLENENGERRGVESEYYERLTLNDIAFKGGAHYMAPLGKQRYLHLGAIYQVYGDISGKEFAKVADFGQASNPNAPGSVLSDNVEGSIYLPNRVGYGVSYEKLNKFMIGLEAQHQDFSKYRSFDGATGVMNNSFKVALGGQYIPDLFSIESVFARSMYRFGVEFEQTPYLVNNTAINDLGINFGASIPMNQLSLMNVAMKLGTRGTTDNGLVQENYFKVSLGFSINDNSWFYKKVFE